MEISYLDRVVLTVRDLEKSDKFYEATLMVLFCQCVKFMSRNKC